MEHDPDVVRWGLHHLLDVWSPGNGGSPQITTEVVYVKQEYCDNDEILARTYQEELSGLAHAQSLGYSNPELELQPMSALAQDWYSCSSYVQGAQSPADGVELFNLCLGPGGTALTEGDESGSPEIEDDSVLGGEEGKWLNLNQIPSADEATSDHQRLLHRLQLYDLVELRVSGDGNCQFRSLSDQIYHTPEHHKFVRQQVVRQLRSYPALYEGYVPMAYGEYLKRMTKNGEWGDHLTLQAAADSYGVRIFVITSFKDTCYIEILPQIHKSNRVLALSFWAEVHYNSIYPSGEFPLSETQKKNKGWWPGR